MTEMEGEMTKWETIQAVRDEVERMQALLARMEEGLDVDEDPAFGCENCAFDGMQRCGMCIPADANNTPWPAHWEPKADDTSIEAQGWRDAQNRAASETDAQAAMKRVRAAWHEYAVIGDAHCWMAVEYAIAGLPIWETNGVDAPKGDETGE
jgi:hypothetical protein